MSYCERMGRRAWVVAAFAFALSTPLLTLGTGGHALNNGDESIYAEMAREMVDNGRVGELTWQGRVLIVRPPATVWILAAARVALGPGERSVRWPNAAAAGAEVALVLLLGTALFRLRTGVAAAGALLGSDLFIGYARYLESEPFLCVFVAGAFLCWELARTRPRWIYGWGALLGCALMTKQVVGGLPLAAILVDRLGEREGRVPGRAIARGLAAAAVVALPWHLYSLVELGRPFAAGFLRTLTARSSTAQLHQTRITYYARELWRSEGVLGLIGVAGVLWALTDGVRRRRRSSLLVALWALGVFAIFSAARSRYDHYLLLAYPALALATGALLQEWLPARSVWQFAAAVVYLSTAAVTHLARDLQHFSGDEEIRWLARAASERYRAPARLYAYNTHAYSARYYATLDVTTLLESAEDFRLAREMEGVGMPCPVELAPDLGADLRQRARPFALLLPRARAELVSGAVGLVLVASTPHYLLWGAD